MSDEQTTTVLRRFQAPYIKKTPTIEPFAYTGDCSRVGGLTKPLGDVEYTDCMDPNRSGGFREDNEIEARPGPVTTSIVMKKSIQQLITAEEWETCRWHVDVRTQFGSDPRVDPLNWDHIDRICGAKFLEYATDDETTYTQNDEGEVLATMNVSGPPLALHHIRRLEVGLIDSNRAGNINTIAKAQDATCPTSEAGPEVGCVLYTGTAAIGGNPLFGKSTDGGQTWTWQSFDGTNNTPTWTGPITGMAALGDLVIAVGPTDTAHAVSQDGGTTWTEIILADYAANAPQHVAIYSPTAIWICGANGYIWKSTDSGMTAATANGGDAGVITTSNLVRIKALTDRFVIAVGASNAIVKTENGGRVWTLVVGPAAQAAVQINSLHMSDQFIWALAYEDGELYWTDDKGTSWTEDDQITDLSLTALNDITECECDRWMVVGELSTGFAYMAENIHGAPNKWEALSVPGDTQELVEVVCCNTNLFAAVGEVTYTGPDGAIVVASGS
jgi:photosystem II stability/assembly factor-like uncharacterized protein